VKLTSTHWVPMARLVVKAFMLTLVHGTLNSTKHSICQKHWRIRGKLNTGSIHVSNNSDGFTLLELLIVVTIFSILFTFSTLAIRTNSPEELIEEEALRLNRLIQLALEEAVLKNTEYGLRFSANGYQFLYYDPESNRWQTIDTDKHLRPRELPHDMEIEVAIEETDIVINSSNDSSEDNDTDQDDLDLDNSDKKLKPQVFLLSSEEISPEFSATFAIPDVETSFIVRGTIDGKHEAEKNDL
jgi:type II secretion system protein H